MHDWILTLRLRLVFWLFKRKVRRLARRDPKRAIKLMRDVVEQLLWHLPKQEDRALYLNKLAMIDARIKANEEREEGERHAPSVD